MSALTSNTTQIQKLLGSKSQVQPFVGTVQSITTTGFLVVIGNASPIPVYPTGYTPGVGESVRIWYIDGIPYLIGPTTPNPATGTVVSVASGLVTLTTTQGTISCPYASTLTPTAGQVMQLTFAGGPFAIAVLSTSATATPTPPSGGGGNPVPHTATFTALSSGSYQAGNGWWTSNVYASNSNLGCWFYGTKIANTLPSTAVIQSVQVYVSPIQIEGSAPNFALHDYASQPAGAPSFASATATAIHAGWVSLPVAFGNALRTGGGYRGIGVDTGGYNILNSVSADGESGALMISAVY